MLTGIGLNPGDKLTFIVNGSDMSGNEVSEEITFEVIGATEATIKIFTPSGRHIRTVEAGNLQTGFNYVPWDGRDQYGDQIANGVYLYKVIESNDSGDRRETLGKLVRAR